MAYVMADVFRHIVLHAPSSRLTTPIRQLREIALVMASFGKVAGKEAPNKLIALVLGLDVKTPMT
jgi:hypothetical protein